jgi:glycosyltransferase involved in cell wall biosynthesis
MKITKILIPIYNDWKSVFKLLENIDLQLDGWDADVSAIIINDASTEKKPDNKTVFKNLSSIKIINMKKNKGHARCIAAGLKYINEKENFDFVIPMDGDGEDLPSEIGPILCKAYDNPGNAITGNRIKRSEGFIFRFCYTAHKYLTFILTSQLIKFGNYSCLPQPIVKKMIKESATWNSFSGSLTKLENIRLSISSTRGQRYFGPSKMSFINLIKHSLSIVAVFKKTFLVRSVFFLLAYLFLIFDKISIITLIPVAGAIIMMISVITLSKRENMSEFNNSLDNIEKIDIIK